MRTCLKILLLLMMPVLAIAQHTRLDSLRRALRAARTDSARVLRLNDLADYYAEINGDSALYYINTGLPIAKRNGRLLDVASYLDSKGYTLMHQGKYPESLECFQQALKLTEDSANESKTWLHDKKYTPHQVRLSVLASIHHDLGHLMGSTNNPDQQIGQYRETKKLAAETGNQALLGLVNMNLGHVYLMSNRLDSALVLNQTAERIFTQTGFRKYLGFVYLAMGDIYSKRGDKRLELQYDHKALNSGNEQKNYAVVATVWSDLTDYYLKEKQKDSSLLYARKLLTVVNFMGAKQYLDRAYSHVYQAYQLAGKTDSAYKYLGLTLAAKDSSFEATTKSLADFQKLSFKAQMHAQELEKEKAAIQTRIRTYVLLAGIAVFMLIAGIFYRNNRQKQKANHLLSEQKEEIETQRDSLSEALNELKATQDQLVQREKMASLGELTAGIAHEIQNPLNFVNNFSEVNTELIEEMQEEIGKGNYDEVKTIADDLKVNMQKISQHGKRADTIVKGMLEHSRTGTGEKQPTDINALADEFLKLSYHGLRAKDKSFNAEMLTHFDSNLPKVSVVQQDIGRVMLNLINNAFYAVDQKAKTAPADYKPTVKVSTVASGGYIQFSVKDNGNGIPNSIKDKIMQPFFTTKPTGEGTGLGLSLSYDIVTKGHGGKIEVKSKEGEGSEFIISLPLS